MVILNISETQKTPKVVFDNEGTLEISGRSVHENPDDFYKEIMDVIEKTKEGKRLQVTFNFEYFNTAAAKKVLKLMNKVADMNGCVVWKYEDGDDDMYQAGLDYKDIMKDACFTVVEK